MSRTNLLLLVALSFSSFLSLSLCSPVPDHHYFKSPRLSDTPPTRRTYSPNRHSRDKHATLRQFPTPTHSPPSHLVPSSPFAESSSKYQVPHHSSPHHENRHSPPSFLSAIASSLASVFNFHQSPTPEPIPEESLLTETPADKETDIQQTHSSHHNVHQNQYSSPSIHPQLDTQHHLERAKRLVEDALSEVDTSSNEDLSPQELFQMVHLWTRMFQAIEHALTPHETPTVPTPLSSSEHEVNEEPPAGAPITQTENIEETRRSALPDIKIALAQAEQLNRQRETERQMKLADLENEQPIDAHYTDNLPKSAPSYPTRLRLQMKARKEHWPSLR